MTWAPCWPEGSPWYAHVMPGCAVCGASLGHPSARYCSRRCRAKADYRRRMDPEAGRDVALVLPCVRCRRWVVDLRAELGGWCQAERWLVCRPLSLGAKPWEPMSEG